MIFGDSGPEGSEIAWAGGLAFVCLLLALACVAGMFSLASYLYELPSPAAERAARAAAARWPAVAGTLYRVTLEKQRAGRGPGVHYQLGGSYRYEVEGRSYTGERFTWDLAARHAYGAENADEFRLIVGRLLPMFDYNRFRDAPQCQNLGAYDGCRVSFEVNERVTVHHDPAAPENAVLEKRDLVPVSLLQHYGSPVAWLLVLGFFLLALAATAWRLASWLLGRYVPPARHEEQRPLLMCWARALGVLFLACMLEFYNVNIGWRGALDDAEAGLASALGLFLLVLMGGTGVYLVFKRRIDRKMGWDRRRRRRNRRHPH